jgi:hypothetical protein
LAGPKAPEATVTVDPVAAEAAAVLFHRDYNHLWNIRKKKINV